MTFWSCRKNGLTRNIRLLSNSWRYNLINNISRSKDNQKRKFGPLSEKYFSSKTMEKMRQGDYLIFFYFLKVVYEVKASGPKLSFNILRRVSMWQLETQLFASSYIWLAYIFEASYSMVVTSFNKKTNVDQSELEK